MSHDIRLVPVPVHGVKISYSREIVVLMVHRVPLPRDILTGCPGTVPGTVPVPVIDPPLCRLSFSVIEQANGSWCDSSQRERQNMFQHEGFSAKENKNTP